MKQSDYILNLILNIIELDENILTLVDIDDIIIQRDALISVLSTDDMCKYNETELDNITNLLVYMNELNVRVDEFLHKRMYIRELCNKK